MPGFAPFGAALFGGEVLDESGGVITPPVEEVPPGTGGVGVTNVASAFRLTASPTFPAGVSVGAYLRRNFAGPPPQPGQRPIGAPVTTAVVDGHGFAVFTGLEPETAYYAGLEVNGAFRWVAFRTEPQSDALGQAVSWGTVSPTGEISGPGTGDWSSILVLPGVYEVQWAVPRSTPAYAITAQALEGSPTTPITAAVSAATINSFMVTLFNASGVPVSGAWSFFSTV